VVKALKKDGWKIINLWGCKLKAKRVHTTLNNLLIKLQKSNVKI